MHKPLRIKLALLLIAAGMQQAAAAPGTLSQVPLYVGPQVEPNMVFLSDDSGSMAWSMLTPENNGVFHLSEFHIYGYTHPEPQLVPDLDNFDWTIPSEEFLQQEYPDLTAEERGGVWRARSHHYNVTYYNPAVTYRPWIGLDKNGNPFEDADPAAAWLNPYDPDAGTTFDLTENIDYWTDHPHIEVSGHFVRDFHPARHYVWDDPRGDSEVRIDDPHELVKIVPGDTYFGGPDRSDCAAAPVCSYAEEIQNFANWFSYHRNRDLIAKNAATRSLTDITGARVGYATINEDADVRMPVASLNLDPEEGNKRQLFDRIYRTHPHGTTPLRQALNRTGRYFEANPGTDSNTIMGNVSSPILPASEGGTCQKNFAVLMTDGYWNESLSGIGNADGDDNTPYDGGPFADDHSNTLADVAMHYYERDLATHLDNEVPTSPGQRPRASHQHMITHTVGFGVTGTLDPELDDPWSTGFPGWPDPTGEDATAERIDDLWHAAFNGRGMYFNARDPLSLGAGLKTIFEDATRGRSTSASVAFNTTRLGTDSMLYQASFNPSDNWSGDLVAINLNIDGSLAGQAWSAAERIDQQLPSQRQVVTWNDDTGSGVPFNDINNLSARQTSDLNTAPSGGDDGLGQARIDYLRGDRSNEGTTSEHGFRVRSSVLGDIVYSNPVYVGRPEMRYEDEFDEEDPDDSGTYAVFRHTHSDRTPVIYVGSNDGMLHGIRASNGEAIFSYVPNRLFSDQPGEGLHYLTDPSYSHRFYVDLSPTVSDIRLDGAWRTVLVGGYRAGGRGIFALDITNPGQLEEGRADDIVLWEFTDEDHASIGHSFSKPTIVQMEDDRFAAVFGNGYNDNGNGEAKLFILYFDGDYQVITTGTGDPTHRNGLSTPALVDSNGDGRADRAYAGDLHGNLWAFDLSNDRVAYRSGQTPEPLFTATNDSGTPQPITSKPVVARNSAGTGGNIAPNILVFFGTGQYIVEGDKTSTEVQTFYGVWDRGRSERNRSHLREQTLTGASTADFRVTTDHLVDYSSEYGWYFDLPDVGERVVVDPNIRGDFVFFNTLIPDMGACNSQGFGWLMVLDLIHGRSPPDPVFDINNDGEVSDADLVGGEFAASGVRMDGIPAGSNFLSDVMYTPDDSGDIDIRRVDAGIRIDSGRMSWREVRPR